MRKSYVFCFLIILSQLFGWAQETVLEVVPEAIPIMESSPTESPHLFRWHYCIILFVILFIVFLQIKRFIDTIGKIKIFGSIFASKKGSYSVDNQKQIEDNVSDNNLAKGISSSHNNPIFNEIKNAINNYLSNNKGSVSDFHLMKDIVDRNCDAKEEEINSQIPVPLYLGLMGTMAGILIGIGYLWISGDLSELLNAKSGTSGVDGIETLLGGVALAMFSSIMGIILTTIGSMKAKDAKAKEEKNKHVFLSWMQANLLPYLSIDTAQTLERMSANLVNFNRTFSYNTKELGTTLQQVNEATTLQKQLLEAVQKLADKDISKQNLDLYNALRRSSQEIATLGNFLRDSNQYLAQVRELNEKLDRNENRTKAIEETAEFFKKEIGQIEQRKEAINKAVGEVDSRLEETFRKLTDDANSNIEAFQQALGKQQDALQKKLNETQALEDELKNLSSIKDSISKFERATAEQNQIIENLTNAITNLVKSKSSSGRINIKVSKLIRLLSIGTTVIVAISCTIYIIRIVFNLIVK